MTNLMAHRRHFHDNLGRFPILLKKVLEGLSRGQCRLAVQDPSGNDRIRPKIVCRNSR